MAMTEFDMSGKVAMVTGASSGFGVHFAKILAQRGAKVVVAARRVDRLESLVNEIKASGGEALAVAMDVTNSDSIVCLLLTKERQHLGQFPWLLIMQVWRKSKAH